MVSEPQCEGCGKRPEVYGSSWCSDCHDFLPRYVKDRIITMREALWQIVYRRRAPADVRQIAQDGLKWKI